MNPRSIRFHLTAWYAALLAAVFLLLGAALFLRLRDYLEGSLLESQSRRAQQIAATLLVNIRQTGESYVVNEIKNIHAPELSNRFIRITRQDGSILYISGPPADQSFDPVDMPAAAASVQRQFSWKQRMPDGHALAIAAFRAAANGGGSYLVEVGASTQGIETMLNHLLLLLAIGLPVMILIVVVGGYFLVGRALTPVARIAGKAEIITQHNLSERLPIEHTGDELERLSVSLNHMITRLDDAFQNSKRFVADASHELRTPLTVVRGELEHLAQEPALAPEHKERLGSLLEEVERLSKIVERLFALSRLDAGEAQAECIEFDLGELAATTADQMSLLADDKKICVTCEAERRVPVKGDRARLKQVVVNLLDNAIKYTPRGGAVRLKVGPLDGHAVLEVTDTGMGIAPNAIPHLFERFFRVEQTRSRDEGGAGLGLSIVKSICSAHGGEIGVESAVGRGSRFRVVLPLAGKNQEAWKS